MKFATKLKLSHTTFVGLLLLGVVEAVTASPAADHWAFQPVQAVRPPAVENDRWARNGIDAFVLARLQEHDVLPLAAASPTTLLRRVHLDLTGLPPTPAEVDAFLADTRPAAYERAVERLLTSPHYGERWGRHWLDMARYADSDGYEHDRVRPHAWRWRDWVLEALNRDQAFNRFTIEQLAGDLLPDASTEQKVATGFNRNPVYNREGGADPEEDRVKRTVDRANTVGKVWLGLTVGCSECHSHKYDPITQREYYGLFAFFNSLAEPEIVAAGPEQIREFESAAALFADKHDAEYLQPIARYKESELPKAQLEWERSGIQSAPNWVVLKPTNVESESGSTLTVQDDGSIFVSGENPSSDVYTVDAYSDLVGITAIRVEVLPDPRLPRGGSGRAENGDFVLSRITLESSPDGSESGMIELRHPVADVSSPARPAAALVLEKEGAGWGVHPHVGARHFVVLETAVDLGAPDSDANTWLKFQLEHKSRPQHGLGRFRLSVTTSRRPAGSWSDDVAQILRQRAADRTGEQAARLSSFYASIDRPLWVLKQAAVDQANLAPRDPREVVFAQAVAELDEPRTTNLHVRGNFLDKGERVEPHAPAVLPPLVARGGRPDRLDLARWLVNRAHPLTARVIINRIWQQYFGRGIVASDDDFGTQGEPPTHPQLLDWLATRFRADGWSLKSIHRLIVTSATYRQSSESRPDLAKLDPENKLLARQNRLRVEAEIIRDMALSASGLLEAQLGGPSVRPRQPTEVAALGFDRGVPWPVSKGKDQYRRGFYTFFQRTAPYAMLTTFDAPDSNASCTRRPRSNTPLQALTLWNDNAFFETAQALGRRVLQQRPAGSIEERIRFAVELCLGRQPSKHESSILRRMYETHVAQYRDEGADAARVSGPGAVFGGVSRAELAAYVLVGRTLLNLDEFVTRE